MGRVGVGVGDMTKAVYDPDNDGLIAVGELELTADKVPLGQGLGSSAIEDDLPAEGDMGLSYKGTITTYTDTTHFKDSGLAGYGDDFFKGYFVYVVRDAGGAGAPPQLETSEVLDYISSDGTFEHDAFSTPLAEGDEVLITLTPYAYGAVVVSDDLMGSAPTERQNQVPYNVYAKVKEYRVPQDGDYRCTWDLKETSGSTAASKIYKNGNPVGVEKTEAGAVYVEQTDDVTGFSRGDLLQLYLKCMDDDPSGWVKNFKVKGKPVQLRGKITQD